MLLLVIPSRYSVTKIHKRRRHERDMEAKTTSRVDIYRSFQGGAILTDVLVHLNG